MAKIIRGITEVMTGCQSHFAAKQIVLQNLKLGFRTDVEFPERIQYSIQPLGAELSCKVHTVHLQTGIKQSLTLTFFHNLSLTQRSVAVYGRMNPCASWFLN